MNRRVIAILLLLAFGWTKLDYEHKLLEQQRAAFFHGAALNLEMRQQLGQAAFLAALSGFRSIVADALWIRAHAAWEETQWGRMALLFSNVTALQPRSLLFWDMAAWHMAWNASVAARENPAQPRETLRIKAQREYFKLGEQFYLDGIENNPDRHLLYERIAMLYRDKLEDHCKAAEYFSKAAKFDTAPSYTARFAAYEMAKCPGREREAYYELKRLYELGDAQRLPTLLTSLREMQEKLDIPQADRIKVEEPPRPN